MSKEVTLNNVNMSDLLPKAVQTIDLEHNGLNIANATKTGYLFCPVGGIFDMSYPNSKLRRGRVQGNGSICPTITCNPDNLWIIDSLEEAPDSTKKTRRVSLRIRRLTEREAYKLMGLKDDEIDLLLASDLSSTAIYKMAGNSIVVDVLKNVFEKMLIPQEDSESDSETKTNSNALF
jgi:DNA (cytosine-5)-methyltransferase 1